VTPVAWLSSASIASNSTPGAFDRAWRDGRAMALEDAVRYALEDKAKPDV
jgi:hypothetical protein